MRARRKRREMKATSHHQMAWQCLLQRKRSILLLLLLLLLYLFLPLILLLHLLVRCRCIETSNGLGLGVWFLAKREVNFSESTLQKNCEKNLKKFLNNLYRVSSLNCSLKKRSLLYAASIK
jgi:hypothetical protein